MATIDGVHYPEGSDTYDLPADWLLHAQTDAQQALDAAAAAVDGIVIPPAGLPYLLMPSGANWPGVAPGIYRIETYSHAQSLTPALPAVILGAGILRVTAPGAYKVYEWLGADRSTWRNSYASGALTGWVRLSVNALEVTTLPTGANWPGVSAGIYRVTTYAHAQGLTPALPGDLLGAGILRVTEPSASYKVYEWVGADGSTWRNSWASSALTGWQKVITSTDTTLAPRTHTDPIRIKTLPSASDWSTLADGVWTVTTFATANSLTPELPAEMKSAFILRITSMNASTRNYEYQSARGKWFTSRNTNDGLLPWTKAASESEVAGYATQEDLGRYVLDGDERMWNRRPPLDTDWTEVTPGLELRRVGQQAYARATSLATTGGIVLATIPDHMTPAGHQDVSFTGAPGYVDATGVHLDATDAATITGVVSWLTDAEWDYTIEGKYLP